MGKFECRADASVGAPAALLLSFDLGVAIVRGDAGGAGMGGSFFIWVIKIDGRLILAALARHFHGDLSGVRNGQTEGANRTVENLRGDVALARADGRAASVIPGAAALPAQDLQEELPSGFLADCGGLSNHRAGLRE